MLRATILALTIAGCAPLDVAAPPAPVALTETALDAPGFIDFLAVDGDAVWATNEGRVERWTAAGKQAEVAMPGPCGSMAVLAGSLWVASCKDGDLYRIDLASGAVQARIASGIANPDGETNVVAGGGSVWVASDAKGQVARIDPASNTVIAHVGVAPGTFFLAFGMDRLWAVSSEGRLLQRIDPASNRVTGSLRLGNQPGFLAAGEGAVWVQEQADGTVARIDPESMALLGRTQVGKSLLYGDIDTGGGSVWLRTTEDQAFVRIDAATGAIVSRHGERVGSGALRYTPRGLWTTAHDVKRISWWALPPKP